MYTRAISIISQMLRNQEDGCIIGARGAWLCETGRWRKWANGALRGRSAQAQVQVRGYKEEKLGLAVRTLCFICPSYRSYDRSWHPPTFSLAETFPAAFVTARYRLHSCVVFSAFFRRNFSTSWTLLLHDSVQLSQVSHNLSFSIFFTFSLFPSRSRIFLDNSQMKLYEIVC